MKFKNQCVEKLSPLSHAKSSKDCICCGFWVFFNCFVLNLLATFKNKGLLLSKKPPGTDFSELKTGKQTELEQEFSILLTAVHMNSNHLDQCLIFLLIKISFDKNPVPFSYHLPLFFFPALPQVARDAIS